MCIESVQIYPFECSVYLVQRDADGRVILLSSSDEEEDLPRDILRVMNGPIDFSIGSTSESGMGELPRSRILKSDEKAHANGSSHFKSTTNGSKKNASVKSQPKNASVKSQPKNASVKSQPQKVRCRCVEFHISYRYKNLVKRLA